jgi:hypothetical protein
MISNTVLVSCDGTLPEGKPCYETLYVSSSDPHFVDLALKDNHWTQIEGMFGGDYCWREHQGGK